MTMAHQLSPGHCHGSLTTFRAPFPHPFFQEMWNITFQQSSVAVLSGSAGRLNIFAAFHGLPHGGLLFLLLVVPFIYFRVELGRNRVRVLPKSRDSGSTRAVESHVGCFTRYNTTDFHYYYFHLLSISP